MVDAPSTGRVDFGRVNDGGLANAESICRAFLPSGKRQSAEWVALNPRRDDHRHGSLKVNLRTGRWADFALGGEAKGGDLVSLVAYVMNIGQREAAIRLAEALGISPYV